MRVFTPVAPYWDLAETLPHILLQSSCTPSPAITSRLDHRTRNVGRGN